MGDITEVKLKHLRIAVAPTFSGLPVSEDIRAAIAALVQQLNHSGAVVEEALPTFDFADAGSKIGELIGMITGAFQPQEKPATLARYLDVKNGGRCPQIREMRCPAITGQNVH